MRSKPRARSVGDVIPPGLSRRSDLHEIALATEKSTIWACTHSMIDCDFLVIDEQNTWPDLIVLVCYVSQVVARVAFTCFNSEYAEHVHRVQALIRLINESG